MGGQAAQEAGRVPGVHEDEAPDDGVERAARQVVREVRDPERDVADARGLRAATCARDGVGVAVYPDDRAAVAD